MATLLPDQGGDTGREVRREMKAYADALVKGGAECIIAGCTETPLVV